jgi:2'-5' RNA ligase
VTPARARLFVALELPDEARSELVRWSREAVAGLGEAIRAVPAESLHVTLCFLGDVAVEDAEAVGDACEAACRDAGGCAGEAGDGCAGEAAGGCAGGAATAGPTSLRLGAPVWLPPRRPRVLAVGIEDRSGGLAELQDRLAARLADGGWYRPEGRPFLAHVTVARARGSRSVRRASLTGPEAVAFRGASVILFRSRLGGAGARYEPLRVVTLDGS